MPQIKVHKCLSSRTKDIEYEIDKNGCWICISHYSTIGYPSIRINNKRMRLSKYVYEQEYGEISKGLIICHHCDNTRCINPIHLFAGTQKDNINDKVYKNRHAKQKGEQHGGHKLTETQVLIIRNDLRTCREIANEYSTCPSVVCNIKNKKAWKHI